MFKRYSTTNDDGQTLIAIGFLSDLSDQKMSNTREFETVKIMLLNYMAVHSDIKTTWYEPKISVSIHAYAI